MFQALFNSLSGLFSFSRSLDTVSNNVANMNTPGFRGGDSFFENVNGGRGTRIAGEGMRTQAGDLRQTGTATDLAIDGNGFFVLRDEDGNYFYTRAGQFRFDDDGLLSDTVTGYNVMAYDPTGALVPIDIDTYRTLAPEATQNISLTGQISTAQTDVILSDIKIFDSAGIVHTLTLKLHSQAGQPPDGTASPGEFTVTISENGVDLPGSYTIKFGADGTPDPTANKIVANLSYLGATQTVTFDLGTGHSGATLLGLVTTLATKEIDGHGTLGATGLSFNGDGVLKVVYSATESVDGPQIALASFRNEGVLEMVGGRLIVGNSATLPDLGRPNAGVFGRIEGGNLELANVDLTQEFADMIIIQRGYQASSRVMTVSNEMIEQLYNSTRGG